MKKKILLILFATPFLLIIIAVTLAMVALNWPTTIINPRTLKFASNSVRPLGVDVDWKRADTSSVSYGAFNEALTIEFEDLCVRVGKVLERSCFPKLAATVHYRFPTIVPKLVALGPVNIVGGDVIVNIPEGKHKKKEASKGVLPIPEIKLPGFVAKAQILPVDVSVGSVEIRSGSPVTIGNAEVHAIPDGTQKIDELTVKGRLGLASGEVFDISAKATSGSHFTKGDLDLFVDAKTNLGKIGNATVNARLGTNDGREIKHDIKVSYSKGKMKGEAALSGIVRKDLIDTTLKGGADNVVEFVRRVSLADCSLKMKSTNERKNQGDLKFRCPINVTMREFDLPDDVDEVYKQPRDLLIDVSAEAATFFMPDMDKKTKGGLKLQLKPAEGRLVKMDGHLFVDFDGVPSRPVKSWNLKSDVDLSFGIDKFAKLAKVLESTPWKIPAPFNVLDGGLEFSLKGMASSETGRAVFPASLSTRLESNEQRMYIESKGETTIELAGEEIGKISLDLDVNFDDVQLQLPNISLARFPKLTPDGRISLKPPEEVKKRSEAMSFDYHLALHTPAERPIRVLSNLTPKFIPVALDLDLKKDDISGTVKIDKFPVKIFSRTATIDRFDLTLREPTDKSAIDGSISVPYIDMIIIIELVGTIGEPVISLASKPPMSQNDILSTLLYGEPMDLLDNDNANSVSNMNAAMAEKSVGLTTFLLLGATPIQSISYNPDTGLFTAKIKLGKKTSLLMGSSETSKELGVRRRLGKGFSIKTGYEKIDESSSGAAAAYIEWSKRY